MHTDCYYHYLNKNNIACPMCKKCVVDPLILEEHIDRQIEAMQMPEEYKDKEMVILCNDCLKKSTVKFHLLGGKCAFCRSYNTTRE